MKSPRYIIATLALLALASPMAAQTSSSELSELGASRVLEANLLDAKDSLLEPSADVPEAEPQGAEASARIESEDFLTESFDNAAASSQQSAGLSSLRASWASFAVSDECFDDLDCAWDQFCHKMGTNDCRDKKEDGDVCSRHGKCLSGCCKVHISWPFQKTCRPVGSCG